MEIWAASKTAVTIDASTNRFRHQVLRWVTTPTVKLDMCQMIKNICASVNLVIRHTCHIPLKPAKEDFCTDEAGCPQQAGPCMPEYVNMLVCCKAARWWFSRDCPWIWKDSRSWSTPQYQHVRAWEKEKYSLRRKLHALIRGCTESMDLEKNSGAFRLLFSQHSIRPWSIKRSKQLAAIKGFRRKLTA